MCLSVVPMTVALSMTSDRYFTGRRVSSVGLTAAADPQLARELVAVLELEIGSVAELEEAALEDPRDPRHVEHIGAEDRHALAEVVGETVGRGHGGHHGDDADDDAEGRQHTAGLVGAQRRQRDPAAPRRWSGACSCRLGLERCRSRSARRRAGSIAVGVARDVVLVGHQEIVLPSACRASKTAMISAPVVAVEVSGRLVGEQDRRLVDQGARDRHPLALAARQLVGSVVHAIGRGRPSRSPPRPAFVRCRRAHAGVDQRAARRCGTRPIARSRLKVWKTKPIFSLRISASSSSPRVPTSAPSRT